MALAFDSLAYAKHLSAAGIKAGEAEAHAEAVRKFIMPDIVTKADLQAALDRQTIKLGAIVFAAAGFIIAALRFLPH
ncbi:hypothetical protein [Terrarubrum flagellatum]|uniref:hypothetical protein n=1 Tax=Terrirubrum flagellatum TaxID=2895980 RepID=UPI00314549FA